MRRRLSAAQRLATSEFFGRYGNEHLPGTVASALLSCVRADTACEVPVKRIIYIGALALAASVTWTSAAEAQIIVHGGVRVHTPRVVVGVYADPFWFDPWWGDYQWGPRPYPYPYPFRYRDPGAAVRLEVKPRETEVYVDGYYAGIVDDFDGVFQRLRVPPGEHEITLYLDGYRTTTQKVYLEPDNTFRIKYDMERLGANEP